MVYHPAMILLLLACPPDSKESLVADPDLVSPLLSTEVRAGVVSDPAALWDGVAAEGRPGDIKIYNSKARYIIQQKGPSSYYSELGGMLIDADYVRPTGQPGQDLIDELGPTIGLGRVVDPDRVEVISDGSSGEARVRVEGKAVALTLLTGALENPNLVTPMDLYVRTDYVLRPDSYLLEVETTVENREGSAQMLSIGELGFMALEIAEKYRPITGFDDANGDTDWSVVVGKRNELTTGIFAAEGQLAMGTAGSLLEAVGPVLTGYGQNVEVAAGGSLSWKVYVGAGPDPASLSGEWLTRQGLAQKEQSGVVTSGGAPVAGVRVHALDADGVPQTMGITDGNGQYRFQVPEAVTSVVATGIGPELILDLPAGHGWLGPYVHDNSGTLASLSAGGLPNAMADGFGRSEAGTGDLSLSAPATLTVGVEDNGPALIRITGTNGTTIDRRLSTESGIQKLGFLASGSMNFSLPPGSYHLMVSRGVQYEVHEEDIALTAGQTAVSVAILGRAYEIPDVVTGDPHTHAAPSGDGDCSMEERLMGLAGSGVQVHFGTDHDHVADYRPLIAPIGLEGVLTSIVADEVSPVLRGHFNTWPLERVPAVSNGGAWLWWQGYVDTAEVFANIRKMGKDTVISANHPVGGSGMFSFGGFSPESGKVSTPTHWSSDLDAMELLNAGDWEEYLPSYLALINRGLIVTPLGVSDSHGPTSGGMGMNLTFFHTNGATTPEALVQAVREQGTVVSKGPYIDARIGTDFAPGKLVSGQTTVSVKVYAPTWIPVDTLTLYKNGEVAETFSCEGGWPVVCSQDYTLNPDADAAYVWIASSSRPMSGPYAGNLAWAATAALRLDSAGNGWESPLPSLFPG
jgi:hypothetical protein